MPGWSWYPTSNAVNSPGLAAPSGPSPPLAVQTPYSARPDLFPVSHTRALSGDPSIHSSSAPSPPSKLHARSSERAASSASSKTTRTVAERGAGVQCGHRMPSSAGLVAISPDPLDCLSMSSESTPHQDPPQDQPDKRDPIFPTAPLTQTPPASEVELGTNQPELVQPPPQPANPNPAKRKRTSSIRAPPSRRSSRFSTDSNASPSTMPTMAQLSSLPLPQETPTLLVSALPEPESPSAPSQLPLGEPAVFTSSSTSVPSAGMSMDQSVSAPSADSTFRTPPAEPAGSSVRGGHDSTELSPAPAPAEPGPQSGSEQIFGDYSLSALHDQPVDVAPQYDVNASDASLAETRLGERRPQALATSNTSTASPAHIHLSPVIARDYAGVEYRADTPPPEPSADLPLDSSTELPPPMLPDQPPADVPAPVTSTEEHDQQRLPQRQYPGRKSNRFRIMSPEKATQPSSEAPPSALIDEPAPAVVDQPPPAVVDQQVGMSDAVPSHCSPAFSDSSLTPPPDSDSDDEIIASPAAAAPVPVRKASGSRPRKARKPSDAEPSRSASPSPKKTVRRKRRLDSSSATPAEAEPEPMPAPATAPEEPKRTIKLKLKTTSSAVQAPPPTGPPHPSVVPENQAPATVVADEQPPEVDADSAGSKRKKARKSIRRVESDEEGDIPPAPASASASAPAPAPAHGMAPAQTTKREKQKLKLTAEPQRLEVKLSPARDEKQDEDKAAPPREPVGKPEAGLSVAKSGIAAMPSFKKKPGAGPPPARTKMRSSPPPVPAPDPDVSVPQPTKVNPPAETLVPPSASVTTAGSSPALGPVGTPQLEAKPKPRPPVPPPRKPMPKPPGVIGGGGGGLLSSTLAQLSGKSTQTPKRDERAKKEDKGKDKADPSAIKPKRLGTAEEEFRLTPEQQKQYDDSAEERQRLHEERHRSYGVNRINLQESKDAYRADSFEKPIWVELTKNEGMAQPDPAELLQLIWDKAEWRNVKS